MILINKVTPFANETFQKDLIECIQHNTDIGFISSIIVFHNNPNIILPKHSKVKIIVKNSYTDKDIIEYCKLISNHDIFIFANPFIKFNNSLISLEKPLTSVSKIGNDGFIFNRNESLIGNSIDDIFKSVKPNNKISVNRIHIWTEEIKKNNTRVNKITPKIQPKEVVVKDNIKIDAVIVSVDYNDFLSITLEKITSMMNVTVVTSSNDIICQSICEKYGANCIVTDRMYENGNVFNKGKAINEGLKSIKNPDWILILDADIYLKDDMLSVIKKSNADINSLLICKRLIIKNEEDFIKWKNGEDLGRIERAKGFGYFQLFNAKSNSNRKFFYSEKFEDASFSDIEFRDRFKAKEELNTYVVHLGETNQNWSGRITEKFVEEDLFDINKYFDKIYCINLDKEENKWNRISKIFKDNSIIVERFSAVDGGLISDIEFNKISKKYNPRELKTEKASFIGLIENKNSLACLLSHLEVIKLARENNHKRILIFEDDVIFGKDFKQQIKKIQNLDWRLLYLGASQFNWIGIDDIDKPTYQCKNTLGTFAYAIDSSIYDEVIELLETKRKSVDNLLSEIQEKNNGYCHTIYPNIVISDVSNSLIREPIELTEYANKVKWNLESFEMCDRKRVLLVPDVEEWAFDNIAKSIIKYNPYPDKIEYTIKYSRDIHQGKDSVILDDWDLIFVMWEAERIIPDGDNVIRGCYSAFWLENNFFSEEKISEFFKSSRGGIFANDFLKDSICKFLPKDYPQTIIHDSTDENKFYPIDNLKEKEFTAIFVGNTNRKIKNYKDIVDICKISDIKLITCTDISNEKLVNYYNKADICINFSTFEGGPQTFLESSLCEVPMLIRSNNELSKLIPCFKGDDKEDFVRIIKKLKNNRVECEEVGKKARNIVLENFTYKKTAKKFADFFLKSLEIDEPNINLDKKDLSKFLTVFIIRSGDNPNYEDCLSSLNNQSVKFNLIEIKDIAPMSKAFQKMIDNCETDYYIQVDEDMILFEDTIEKIYDRLITTEDNISIIAHMLNDNHLDFDIYGIKGYKHKIMKNYPYNLEIISCEVEQMTRLQNDGFETFMYPEVVGYHSPKWTEQLIYERYFDLMEKWKVFKYDWLGELPAKLMEIFKLDPSNINLFALMGAMTSISNESPIRNREKNFLIKDENFERIERLISKEEFKFIRNDKKSNTPQILDKKHVRNK